MTCEACYCSRCAPSDAPVQCSVCGQEVRSGHRDGEHGWWHRGPVDHMTILGHRATYADLEALRHEYEDVVRHGPEGEPYRTAEVDIAKAKDVARRRARLAAIYGAEEEAPLPEPEVPLHDVEVYDLPPRSGMRQVANLVLKTDGWDLVSLASSTGPYLGSDGSVLSISERLVLKARGPKLDSGTAIAVASWRDGKFDTAYAGRLVGDRVQVDSVNATDLKSWIKEPA